MTSYGTGVVMCKPYTGRPNAEQHCKIIIPMIDDGIQKSSNKDKTYFTR